MTLKERVAKLAEVSGKLKKVFDQAGPDLDTEKITEFSGTAKEKIASLRKLKAEEDELGKEVDEAQELLRMKKDNEEREKQARDLSRPEHPAPSKGEPTKPDEKYKGMGMGDIFMASCKNKPLDFKEKDASTEGMSFKTLMETGAGWLPQSIRSGEVVPIATRPLAVIDIIPQGQTGQASVVYMENTTFTNNAAERAEGGTFGEAGLVYTQRSVEAEDIAVWMPVTDRQLEDVPMVQGEINRILPFMIQQRLDSQILNGNGTTPNLEGILNKGDIQTQAKGGDLIADAFYKAMTKIRSNAFAEPSAHIIHPNDWQDVRLMKDLNGNYIWGHPAESGLERLWGKLVVNTTAIAEGTGLTGDFAMWCTLFERFGIVMKITDSEASFFINGKQAIRAIMRAAMVWKRPSAFATVTGI